LPPSLHSFPTRRSSDLLVQGLEGVLELAGPDLETPGVGGDRGDLRAVQPAGRGERQAGCRAARVVAPAVAADPAELSGAYDDDRAEEHTSELQSRSDLV